MAPNLATVKRLFSLSMNVCAFQDPDSRETCENKFAIPTGATVNADICHIRGSKPDSARHDLDMSPEKCDGFSNLILLCPTHHRLIDSVEPARFTVEVLEGMKERSLNAADATAGWASDELVEWAARSLIAISIYLTRSEPLPIIPKAENLTGSANVAVSFEATLGRAPDADSAGRPTVQAQDAVFKSETATRGEGIRDASDMSLNEDGVNRGQGIRGASEKSLNEDAVDRG